jgi:nucleotide-binding universal stress UspA family protein
MVNILVPTDFSQRSKVAVQYALRIAGRLDAHITLLHVVTITQTVKASVHDKIKALEEDLIRFAERDLADLIAEACKKIKTDTTLDYRVVRATDFSAAVKREAKRLGTDLIVMGTRGASGIRKTVVGSNTASVIALSNVPVLAVPDRGQFKGIKDIVYASDTRNLDKELKILLPYAETFDATLHVVHILPRGGDIEALEEKIERAVRKLDYKNTVSLVLVDRSIEGAIDQYIGVCKADLLCMFTHDLTFYEKVFDRSMTRKMAFQSLVPLLAFKNKRG